jgi:thiamine pyrophosphate-dependent acetolactate synthase large subunit-like protein
MSLAELDTAVRYRLPILVVVVNDGGYGAEVKVLEHHGWSPSLATFQNPEIAKLAQAFGATAITVRSQSDLNAVRDHLPLDGPLLVDVQVDPTVTAHWVELARTGA